LGGIKVNEDIRKELYLEKWRKGISYRKIAKYVGCTEALICMFLKNKANLSSEKFNRLKEYIEGYQGSRQ
jgi:cyanate lyase